VNELMETGKIDALLTRLTENQIVNNNKITGFELRLSNVEEVIKKDIYLTNSQLREVSRQVKSKVFNLCLEKGYGYQAVSKFLFHAIYSSINGQYNVMSYRELPRMFFTEIIDKIQAWTPTEEFEKRIA